MLRWGMIAVAVAVIVYVGANWTPPPGPAGTGEVHVAPRPPAAIAGVHCDARDAPSTKAEELRIALKP